MLVFTRYSCFWLFVFLGLQLRGQTLDKKVLLSLNKNEYPVWDKIMLGTSKSVFLVMPLTVLGIAADGYVHNNQVMQRNALKSAVTIGLATLSTAGLKYTINRPRPGTKYPDEVIVRDHAGPYSFPSGHTAAAFASATALSLSYNKWYVTLPSYLYAGLVGYSRMRLGMHFPSDVLGGMVIGIGAGLLTWQLDKAINQR